MTDSTRRAFLGSTVSAAVLLAVAGRATATAGSTTPPAGSSGDALGAPGLGAVGVLLRVNGRDVPLALDPRPTLLDALREHAELPGTKKGCDHGQRGACTVLVDGRRINSCLVACLSLDQRILQEALRRK